MGLHVHGDERRQLRQPGIDHAPGTAILEAHGLDRQMLQLTHGDAVAEIGDLGRGGVGVDGAADQGQGARLRGRLLLRQDGGRDKGQGRRLTHRDDIHVGTQVADEIDQVAGIILDVELALADRNVAGIVPIGHVEFAVVQKRQHGRAHQGRIVTRHRRDQQDLAGQGVATGDAEMDQVAEGPAQDRLDIDDVVLPVLSGDGGDLPVGLDHHACEAAFGDTAPGPQHPERGMRDQREGGIGPDRAGGRAHPFVRVPNRLHRVIGHDAAKTFDRHVTPQLLRRGT